MAKRILHIRLRVCERPSLPPEMWEQVLLKLLPTNPHNISCTKTAVAYFPAMWALRLVERTNKYLVHRALVPLLHSLYEAKAPIAGLTIHHANRLLDLVPYYVQDETVENTWLLYSLIVYHERRAAHPLEQFSAFWNGTRQREYFTAKDSMASFFSFKYTMGQVVPFAQSSESLFVVEGLEEKPGPYRTQRKRYLESFDDPDTRARLKHLLIKSGMEESRGYFVEALLSLHSPVEGLVSAETLMRRKAFPLTVRRLVPGDAHLGMNTVIFRLGKDDHRFFLTSQHEEVMRLKSTLYRIHGDSLEEAQTAFRLHSAEGAMRSQQEKLVRELPTLIHIL
jgi:hypothetical protein